MTLTPSDTFSSNQDLFFSNDFDYFSSFTDPMGLNAGLDFLFDPAFNIHDLSFSGNELSHAAFESTQTPMRIPQTASAAPAPTRIRPMEDDFEELGPVPCPWKVSDDQRSNICAALLPFKKRLESFVLPSHLQLGRYITPFFEVFQDHLPIIHPVSLRPPQFHKHPGLLLAMAAIGAQYRYENRTAMELFRAGKEVVLQTWQDEETYGADDDACLENAITQMHTAQAALLLDSFAVYQCDDRTAKDTLTLQSLLTSYLRTDSSLSKYSGSKDWHEWMMHESYRRTQLGIFVVLNIHTIHSNAPPIVLSSQIDVDLPCSTAEWLAPSENAWKDARSRSPGAVGFQDALSILFSSSPTDKELHYSPFANLVLIHALQQRIYLARQMNTHHRGALRGTDVDEIE